MKNIDIENIGRQMPYAPLKEGYFQEFQKEMLSRLEVENKKRLLRRKIITSSVAAVLLGIVISTATLVSKSNNRTIVASTIQNQEVEQFIDNLSDEELATIVDENEITSEFYANL